MRAYLYLDEVKLGGTEPHAVVFTIKNMGQTPAYDFATVSTFDLSKFPRQEFRHSSYNPNAPESISTLGPGAVAVCHRSLLAPLSQEQYKRIAEGTLALFLFGRITYRDAFKKKRFTNFRFKSEYLGNVDVVLMQTAKGNESN